MLRAEASLASASLYRGKLYCYSLFINILTLALQKWNGEYFEQSSLHDLGLVVQLNHTSFSCPLPEDSHKDFTVLDSNGMHQVNVKFCSCTKQLPHHIQLLRRGWYPSTQKNPHTMASFCYLEQLDMLSLAGKISVYNCYCACEKQTCNTGINPPKVQAHCSVMLFNLLTYLSVSLCAAHAYATTVETSKATEERGLCT